MLSGLGLEIAIAMLLGGAVSLGFVLHWLWQALGGHKTEAAQIEELADRLHKADLAREAADAARLEAETALAQHEAATAEQLALMQGRLDSTVDERGAELARQLDAARLEAEALRSGLGNAHQRILRLEEELEALRGRAS